MNLSKTQIPATAGARGVKPEEVEIYVCPETREQLRLKRIDDTNGDVVSGSLVSVAGREYPIRNGVPDLTYPSDLTEVDAQTRGFYEDRAEAYDKNLHLTFQTHREDEQKVRNMFVDALELKPSDRVLEIACGTGRDSEIIAQRLGPNGLLCLQDIASAMLRVCQKRLSKVDVKTSYCVSNACYL